MAKFRVKELAQARGLTTEQLAIKANVRISTARRLWQNRVDDPSFSTLRALAGALDVRIEDLVVSEEAPAAHDAGTQRVVLSAI